MSSATEKLTRLVAAEDRFDHSHEELRETQLEALNERFQERKDRIKLLGHRAREAGTTEIRSREDMVPLLFPHSVYKSYPERFLIEEKWDLLGKWLGAVSPYPISPVETADVTGIDDWIERLQAKGHYVSCSSGTTGKSAMLLASDKDMDWSRKDTVSVFAWGSGVQPARDRRMMGLAPTAAVPKNLVIGQAQQEAFGDPAKERFRLPVPPITVGSLTKMVVLRKKIAEGTALPEELADFEQTSRERQETLDKAMVAGAEALIKYRDEKLYISGLWNALYQVAKIVRGMGYSAKDFHPDNCIYIGGGLKRAQLPPDYQEFVHQTFNIPANRNFQNYSMQELNSGMPKCQRGDRYHVPPWLVPFILDEEGGAMLPHEAGEIEGRAAFYDLSLDGRWGGIITGDKISLDFSPCACGRKGASVRNNIVRYADIQGRRQDRLRRHRRRLCARPVMNAVNTELKPADAPVLGNVVSAPFFLRGELVEGQDAGTARATWESRSRRRGSTWTGWCIRVPRCRRCSTSRSRKSLTSSSRPASGFAIPATSSRRNVSTACPPPTCCPGPCWKHRSRARRHTSTSDCSKRWSSRTFPIPGRWTSGCQNGISPGARASFALSRPG